MRSDNNSIFFEFEYILFYISHARTKCKKTRTKLLSQHVSILTRNDKKMCGIWIENEKNTKKIVVDTNEKRKKKVPSKSGQRKKDLKSRLLSTIVTKTWICAHSVNFVRQLFLFALIIRFHVRVHFFFFLSCHSIPFNYAEHLFPYNR